jgi:hypothetical protein
MIFRDFFVEILKNIAMSSVLFMMLPFAYPAIYTIIAVMTLAMYFGIHDTKTLYVGGGIFALVGIWNLIGRCAASQLN